MSRLNDVLIKQGIIKPDKAEEIKVKADKRKSAKLKADDKSLKDMSKAELIALIKELRE